jgi:hypothetical protein
MRWLAILAILVAGAAGYLVWSMSGATAPARASQSRAGEVEREPEPEPTKPDRVTAAPPRDVRPPPVVASKRDTAPVAPPPTIDRPAATQTPPPDAATEEVEWTEDQRKQQLYTAHGRYEKGNYPGAIQAAMELARRYPPWAEDGYKVAIMAHCAMAEPEKANDLYAKMTDKPAIEELTKACTGWGVTLGKK